MNSLQTVAHAMCPLPLWLALQVYGNAVSPEALHTLMLRLHPGSDHNVTVRAALRGTALSRTLDALQV